MNGCLIPHTPIAVDFWKIRECPQARIFFLTHVHGDHITGLTSSWSFPIYCSEITGKLLVQRYGVQEDLIHSMQIECPEIIYLDAEGQEQMTVTTIDANHCPGAVMFLMEGYFGTILHTGDFRYHPDMVSQSVLSKYSGKVDVLYLDNTYCSPDCVFPTREETTSSIISIIEKHPEHCILIAMRNLGKEDLLCKLALHFQEWISVPDTFYKTLEILGAPDVFDNNSAAHRLRVVPFHLISNKFVNQVNENQPTIVILPTALYHGIDAKPYENNSNVFVVPYSDHSSFTELRNFVSFIKPRKIIPVVKAKSRGPFGLNIADRADMSVFSDFVKGDWISKVEIPLSVQAFMHPKYNKLQSAGSKGLKRKAIVKASFAKKAKRGVTYESPKCIAKGPTESSDENLVETESVNENEKENLSDGKNGTQQVKRSLFEKTVRVEKNIKDFGAECAKEKYTLSGGRRSQSVFKQDSTLPVEKSVLAGKGLKIKVNIDRENEVDEIELCSQTNQCKVSEGKSRGTVEPNEEQEKWPDVAVGVTKQRPQGIDEIVVEMCDTSCGNKKDKRENSKAKCNPKTAIQHTHKNHTFSRISKNKEKCVSLRKGDTGNGKHMPNSHEECSRVYAVKRIAKKTPEKFTASKPGDKFGEAFGMKTYSKTPNRKCSTVSRIHEAQLAAERKREMQMSITAEWVLKAVNHNANRISERGDRWNEVKEEDIFTLKHDSANICESERKERLKSSSQAVASDDLKQATLSQYFRKSNENSSVSDIHDKKEVYYARKLSNFENLQKQQQKKGNVHIQSQVLEDYVRTGEETGEDRSVIAGDTQSLENNNGNIGSQLVQKESTASVETECRLNASDDSVKAQVGTQVQSSEVNFKSSITAEKIIEKKSFVTKAVTEVAEMLNTSSEPVTAQAGIQINTLNRHSRCDGLKLNTEDINDLDDIHVAIKTNTKESLEETRDGFENKPDKLETEQNGRSCQKISGKQNDGVDKDLSVLVNVGSQMNIRELEGTDTCKVKVNGIKGKQYRKNRIFCKQCELEAFQEVFKQLENSKLKETESLVKKRQLKLKTHKNTLESAGNGNCSNFSFRIKPVNN